MISALRRRMRYCLRVAVYVPGSQLVVKLKLLPSGATTYWSRRPFLKTAITVDPEHLQLPPGGCPAVPAPPFLVNAITLPLGQLQVPTMLPQDDFGEAVSSPSAC